MIPYRLQASLVRKLMSNLGYGAGGGLLSSGEIKAVEWALTRGGKSTNAPLTIFDVGGNVGLWTQSILGRCPHAHIHAFEPSAAARAQFEAKHASNSKVTLVPMALSHEAGKATLYADSPASGLASLTKRDLRAHNLEMSLSEDIELTTLDAYAASNSIEKIDFLKLDVEGHELDVLRGAQGMLERGGIDALQFEFGGSNIDTRVFFRDMFYFLNERGFKIYIVRKRGQPHLIDAYREFHEQFRTTNYLAMREK